jgi:hypothetical protein
MAGGLTPETGRRRSMGIVATKLSTSNEKTAHTPGPWHLSRLQDIDPDRYAGTDSPMLAVVEQVRAAIAKAEGK